MQKITIRDGVECHRPLIKVICNPILRKFGWSLVSVFDENNQFEKYEFRKYPEFCGMIK